MVCGHFERRPRYVSKSTGLILISSCALVFCIHTWVHQATSTHHLATVHISITGLQRLISDGLSGDNNITNYHDVNLDFEKSVHFLEGDDVNNTYLWSVSSALISPRKLGNNAHFQPMVTVVESSPSRKNFNSVSIPEGSPWCRGQPTYWLVGHQKDEETPMCQDSRGAWMKQYVAILDAKDKLNDRDSNFIDRHSCTVMDVNRDGIPDIICLVGADSGAGKGYNELYITQRDGTLKKIYGNTGLQKYPSMRNRLATVLTGIRGEQFLFAATKAVRRKDNKPNTHRMFQNIYRGDGIFPYFREVKGPWTKYIETSSVRGHDINRDGREDLIMCNEKGQGFIALQGATGKWRKLGLPKGDYTEYWRNLRIDDVTGDGVDDLIVTYQGEPSFIRIFKGQRKHPYFDFKNPWYEQKLTYAAPDVEILDVNGDGRKDIYIVQVSEKNKKSYCGSGDPNRYWGGSVQPPDNWRPPVDKWKDILLIGLRSGSNHFRLVTMQHAYPGCGFLSVRFGDDKKMLLAQGNNGHAGYELLLEWS